MIKNDYMSQIKSEFKTFKLPLKAVFNIYRNYIIPHSEKK